MAAITWDAAKTHAGQIDLTGGDLIATCNVAPWRGVGATTGWSSGKYYWEITPLNFQNPSSHSVCIGVAVAAHTVDSYLGAGDGYGIADDGGVIYQNGLANDPIGPFGDYEINEVIGVALDMDNGKLFIAREGTWFNTGDPVAGTGFVASSISGTYFPWCSMISAVSGSSVSANFGVAGPEQTIPAGYTMPDYVPPVGIPSGRKGFTSRSAFMHRR